MKKEHEKQLLEFVLKHYIYGNGYGVSFDFVKDEVFEFAKPTSKTQNDLLAKIQNGDHFKSMQETLVRKYKVSEFEAEDLVNFPIIELINDVIVALVNSDVIKLNI